MARSTVTWAVFIAILIAALVTFFAVRGGLGPAPPAPGDEAAGTSEAPAEPASMPAATVTLADAEWPMFHGCQEQLGRADGTLADSLTLLWKFQTDDQVKSSPVISDSRVFVGSSDENLYALGLQTGEKLWAYGTEGVIEATPLVLDGTVYIGSADRFLHALDAETGELNWKYETDGQVLGSANWTRSPDGRTRVLVGSYDNLLHCVDADSGEALWTYETDNYVNGSPAVSEGKTVFGGCDALIHVVSLADGSRVTRIDSGSYIAASAAFVDGQVYVGNYDNVFLRADVGKGEVVWRYEQSDAPFFSSPAIGEDLVVLGGRDTYVHAVRRDSGERVWRFKTLDEVNSSPVICDGKVVVGSDDGRLYMLRMTDGKKLWSYEMGLPIISSPAVAGGLVVVGCDDGYVYAFGPEGTGGSQTP